MPLKFYLVYINEGLRKKGNLLTFAGIGIVLLNGLLLTATHQMPEKTGVWISALGIIIAISGLITRGSAEYKKEKVGSLIIDDFAIVIAEKDTTGIRLLRKDFRFEVKNPGFEGMNKTYNIFMFGSIVPHPGINEVKIFNRQEEFRLHILVENKERLDSLLALRA